MTFAEYYKRVIELGPDVAGQRTFWINLPTPEKGVQVYTSAPPSPSADESEYQEFFTEEMQKLGVRCKHCFHLKEQTLVCFALCFFPSPTLFCLVNQCSHSHLVPILNGCC